jgi:hypothetical protein
MTDLSPAAASIVLAFDDRYEICSMFNENWQEECLAAVLRAAADQVVPKTPALSYPEDYELGVWVANDDTRTELLAIAAELEALDD